MGVRVSEPAPSAYVYPLLIKQLLHTPIATAPDQEIVYRDRHRYRYRDLNERLGRLASGLHGLGVQQGSTVAVMEWESHRFLECYFAIPMYGAVLQTVNVRLAPEQILFTLQDTAAEVLLFNRDFLPLVESLRPRLDKIRAFVIFEDDPTPPPAPGFISCDYETLLAGAAPDFEFADFDENAVATTFHTTGTTGNPKSVVFSHRQIVLHTLAALGALASAPYGHSFRHGDVYMPLTPMFHVHAWGMPFVATLLGVKQVYPGRYVPAELIALRAREGVTYSHCVPTILRMVLSAAAAAGADLHGWKMTIGGSALSPGLAREALAAGIDVHAGYGMSETAPVLTLARLREPATPVPSAHELAERCCAGLPLALVELRIVDEQMNFLPHDGVSAGELVVRSPWLTLCYARNPEASVQLWRGSWMHTQDVAMIGPAGHLHLTDRLKDVIKTGGEWLSSLDLEAVISQLAGVAEVTVVAEPDARWGERPHAFVVAAAGTVPAPTAAVVRAHVGLAVARGELPKYAIPEHVTLIAALPKTSVGKIDKRQLRSRLGAALSPGKKYPSGPAGA